MLKPLEPLFSVSHKPIKQAAVSEIPAVCDIADSPSGKLCKHGDVLSELFPEVPTGSTHYVSANDWSICEMLMHFLSLTGPADVYFSTWSLKEFGVRQLLAAMDSGSILTLNGLLDSRVKSRNPDVYFLSERNFSTIRLAECHAKVCVIRNELHSISIVGSANFTNNPRIEVGVISTDRTIADFHQKWISDVIKQAHPFRNGDR